MFLDGAELLRHIWSTLTWGPSEQTLSHSSKQFRLNKDSCWENKKDYAFLFIFKRECELMELLCTDAMLIATYNVILKLCDGHGCTSFQCGRAKAAQCGSLSSG